jgi:hypothetical protein
MMDSTRQSLGEHFDDFLFDEREDLSADRFLALHLSICSLKQAYDVYMGKPSSRLYNFRTADEWKQHVYREISTKARTKTENAYQSFSAAPSSEQELQERMVKNLALEWNRFQTIYHKFYRHALLGLDLALLTDSHEENTNVALVNLAGLAVIESASSIDRAYAFTSGQSDWIDIDQHMQPAMQCLRYFASLLDRPSLTNELRPYLKQTLNVSIETFAADFCERTLPNVPPFAYLQVRQIPLDSIVELSGLIVNRLKEVSGGGADGQVPFLRNDYLVQLARISNVYQNGLMMNAYLLALVCAKINTSALDSPVSALCRTVPALISNIRNCLTCLVFCKSADTKAIEHFVAFIRGCRTTATVPLALHHHQQQQQPFCLSLLTDQPPKHLLVAFIDALLKGNHWLAAESILNSNHADGWVLYLLAMLCFYRGEHGKALEYFLKFAPAISKP